MIISDPLFLFPFPSIEQAQQHFLPLIGLCHHRHAHLEQYILYTVIYHRLRQVTVAYPAFGSLHIFCGLLHNTVCMLQAVLPCTQI